MRLIYRITIRLPISVVQKLGRSHASPGFCHLCRVISMLMSTQSMAQMEEEEEEEEEGETELSVNTKRDRRTDG